MGTVLDSFIDNFLSFFNSEETSCKVKIFTIQFIDRAVRFDPTIITKIARPFHQCLINLSDSSEVHKKIIIIVTQLYPIVLQWVASRKNDSEVEGICEGLNILKERIMQMVDSKNEGYVFRNF